MSASLVEDNTAKAVLNCNGHSACGAVVSLEVDHCLTSRLATDVSRVDKIEEFQTHSATGTVEARLVNACRACNRADRHTRADVTVGCIKSLGVGNKDGVVNAKQRTADLRDRLVILLCGKAAGSEKVGANARVNARGNDLCRMNVREHTLVQDNLLGCAKLTRSGGYCARTFEKSRTGGVGRRSEYGFCSQKSADAHAGYQVVGYAVDLTVDHVDAVVSSDLAIELYKISSSAHSRSKNFLGQCFCNHCSFSPYSKIFQSVLFSLSTRGNRSVSVSHRCHKRERSSWVQGCRSGTITVYIPAA